jgi:hypothetical protein
MDNDIDVAWVRFLCGELGVVCGLGRGCQEGSVLLRSGLSKNLDGQEEP